MVIILYLVLSSHAWDFNPNTGCVVNNSTVTPTPDVDFTATGSYIVTHTISSMGCSYTATTNVLVNICTFLKEDFETFFSIFPNPSSDGNFNIAYPEYLRGKLNVDIYDVIGKLVYSKQKLSSNQIAFIPLSGIYFLKVSDEQHKCYFKKIIIE